MSQLLLLNQLKKKVDEIEDNLRLKRKEQDDHKPALIEFEKKLHSYLERHQDEKSIVLSNKLRYESERHQKEIDLLNLELDKAVKAYKNQQTRVDWYYKMH